MSTASFLHMIYLTPPQTFFLLELLHIHKDEEEGEDALRHTKAIIRELEMAQVIPV